MRLISAVLGFVLKKAALVGVIVVVSALIFGLGSQLDEVQQAKRDLDELDRVRAENAVLSEKLDAHVDDLERTAQEAARTADRTFEGLSSTAADRVRSAKQACGLVGRLEPYVPGPNPCTDAKRRAEAAQARVVAARKELGKVKRRLGILAADNLSPADKLERLNENSGQTRRLRSLETREAALDDVEGSSVGRFARASDWAAEQWAQAWKSVLWIALLVVFAPLIWRTLGYFLVMPMVSRTHQPLRLAAAANHLAATIHAGSAVRTLPIQLSAGEVLSARSEYVRPVQGKVRSGILYDWRAPFISFAAGLHSLSRVSGDDNGADAMLAAPDDPNSYLMRIDFRDHPGVVLRPSHVVGVMGSPELMTRWRWGIQSLATWQVRYIMFAGSGSLIVRGRGDVQAPSPGDRPVRIEQDLMMGFDSRLTAGVNRTEVFWEYLLGRTPLIDREFTGPYPYFWQTSISGGSSNPIVKATSAVFSALGKLLGF